MNERIDNLIKTLDVLTKLQANESTHVNREIQLVVKALQEELKLN